MRKTKWLHAGCGCRTASGPARAAPRDGLQRRRTCSGVDRGWAFLGALGFSAEDRALVSGSGQDSGRGDGPEGLVVRALGVGARADAGIVRRFHGDRLARLRGGAGALAGQRRQNLSSIRSCGATAFVVTPAQIARQGYAASTAGHAPVGRGHAAGHWQGRHIRAVASGSEPRRPTRFRSGEHSIRLRWRTRPLGLPVN